MKRFKMATQIFAAVLRGEEFVLRSPVASEEVVGFYHPDGPIWATREEVYYNASSFGTGAQIVLR